MRNLFFILLTVLSLIAIQNATAQAPGLICPSVITIIPGSLSCNSEAALKNEVCFYRITVNS